VLLYADMDKMKEINDKFGHKVGDNALIDTAAILKSTFRDSDIIARVGGDEFVVLAIGATRSKARIFIKHLKENIKTHSEKKRRYNYKLSLSIGIALYSYKSPCSIKELLSRADKMMYKRKQEKN